MQDIVKWFAARARRELASASALVVAAHPDDETIGVGGLLPRFGDVVVLHVTDGAPRCRRWWGAPSLPSRAAYARARRREARAALALAGVAGTRLRSLRIPDQEASRDLARLARRLARLLAGLGPDLVLTHPYEGGHPDHDASAFAVHAAVRLLRRRGGARRLPPHVVEFTSYHAAPDGGLATGRFLPTQGTEADECDVALAPAERDRKRRMLAAFATQRAALAPFGVDVERFRSAPRYDFAAAPHGRPLHYERFAWGWTGAAWRARAREAERRLGLRAEAEC